MSFTIIFSPAFCGWLRLWGVLVAQIVALVVAIHSPYPAIGAMMMPLMVATGVGLAIIYERRVRPEIDRLTLLERDSQYIDRAK